MFKPFAQRKVHLLQPKDFGPKPQADPRSLRSKARLHWTNPVPSGGPVCWQGCKTGSIMIHSNFKKVSGWNCYNYKWKNISIVLSLYVNIYLYLHFLCTYTWIWWDWNHSELGGAPLCSRSMSWCFCPLLAFKLRVGSRWFPKLPEFWLSKLSEITQPWGKFRYNKEAICKIKGQVKVHLLQLPPTLPSAILQLIRRLRGQRSSEPQKLAAQRLLHATHAARRLRHGAALGVAQATAMRRSGWMWRLTCKLPGDKKSCGMKTNSHGTVCNGCVYLCISAPLCGQWVASEQPKGCFRSNLTGALFGHVGIETECSLRMCWDPKISLIP